MSTEARYQLPQREHIWITSLRTELWPSSSLIDLLPLFPARLTIVATFIAHTCISIRVSEPHSIGSGPGPAFSELTVHLPKGFVHCRLIKVLGEDVSGV